MKKYSVGILTFHNAINYGAILQAFALFSKLKAYYPGSVEVIDYQSNAINSRYEFNFFRLVFRGDLSQLLKKLVLWRTLQKRKKHFRRFLAQHFVISSAIDSSNSAGFLFNKYSDVIVGSDQVWNNDIIEFDKTYLLAFDNCEFRKHSYAASVGKDLLSEYEIEFLKQGLLSFDNISVRESLTADVLGKHLDLGILEHLDPVFLLKAEEWQRLVPSSFIPKDIVFVYLLRKSDKLLKLAKALAAEYGLRIVQFRTGARKSKGVHYPKNESVENFLGYLMTARFVITNSYHGICFSVLFGKDFFYELQADGSKTNLRIRSIIEKFHLQSCEVGREGLTDYQKKFCSKLIQEEMSRSSKYLQSICQPS